MATKIISTMRQGDNGAKIRYNSEYKEYIVQFFINDKWQTNADYYTDNKTDALTTAHAFCNTDYYKQTLKYFAPLDEIAEALVNNEGISMLSNEELKAFYAQSKPLQKDLLQFENFILITE